MALTMWEERTAAPAVLIAQPLFGCPTGTESTNSTNVQAHSLGVLLDPQLSLDAQGASVAREAFVQLWLACRLQPYLGQLDPAMVAQALVASQLDYCNALYGGLPLKTVQSCSKCRMGRLSWSLGFGMQSPLCRCYNGYTGCPFLFEPNSRCG